MAHDTDEFDAKFQELIQNIAHHVEEEEAQMFPLAEEELAEDLTELKEEMQELKVQLQSSYSGSPTSPVHDVQGTAFMALLSARRVSQ